MEIQAKIWLTVVIVSMDTPSVIYLPHVYIIETHILRSWDNTQLGLWSVGQKLLTRKTSVVNHIIIISREIVEIMDTLKI